MIGSRFVYAKIFDEIEGFRVACGFISSQDFVSK